ncbi:hypothetical protein SAMN05216319_5120 [Duganella sp. CF402]|uniref:hypothetical protein n=1 Tax=unclassified Duganella TaxID=2636909 RepID=UPI0008B97578|nr:MULTISPECIES: hypothetical protein [unclassified Duganella]RZT05584.1 hypothetical protein EV582_3899 [Duganella sp. BK701]SEM98679.1 hypothetical protein SAMN05216319_5120 [Duganella sp. CF402]
MVCLAFAGNVPAEARPASHSGTSKSFKSGFSSQKNNSAAHSRPAPPANRQSGPGAFGQQAGSPAQQQRNTSAMSRDVDQSAARERALRTLDQRRTAANAPQPLPPVPAPRPAPAYGAPPYAPSPVYAPPAQQSNGLMAGVLGFMLGRAMSQSNQPVAYPTTNGNQPAPAATVPADAAGAAATAGPDGTGLVGGMPGLGAPAPAAIPAPPPEPSFMAGVLRLFAWLSILSLLGWAAFYSVRKFRRLRAGPNYSFERN